MHIQEYSKVREENSIFILLYLTVKGHPERPTLPHLPQSQAGVILQSKLHKTGEDGFKEMLKKIQETDLSSLVHDLLIQEINFLFISSSHYLSNSFLKVFFFPYKRPEQLKDLK